LQRSSVTYFKNKFMADRRFAAGVSYLATQPKKMAADEIVTVLLHGIGSAAESWSQQLAAASQVHAATLAWDAPGYGQSEFLESNQPGVADYATRLWDWLEALDIKANIHIVGHSLGALIAAQAAVQKPQRIARLTLLSPALGYAESSAIEQQQVLRQRIETLQTLGPKGMAEKRGAAMLSKNATDQMVSEVKTLMARVTQRGYSQAVHMLVAGDLIADLHIIKLLIPNLNIQVASGDADTITPPERCYLAAQAVNTPLISLGPVGHACAIEAPYTINQLLGFSHG
jgi:pimeloyl-ACP methyl ester carboxylesterase